jgi:hypothetical protein
VAIAVADDHQRGEAALAATLHGLDTGFICTVRSIFNCSAST